MKAMRERILFGLLYLFTTVLFEVGIVADLIILLFEPKSYCS